MKKFKVKFWGTKIKRGQLLLQTEIIEARKEEIEEKLARMGWVTVHGLKIRELKED